MDMTNILNKQRKVRVAKYHTTVAIHHTPFYAESDSQGSAFNCALATRHFLENNTRMMKWVLCAEH